jgi:hypothetical protein
MAMGRMCSTFVKLGAWEMFAEVLTGKANPTWDLPAAVCPEPVKGDQPLPRWFLTRTPAGDIYVQLGRFAAVASPC